MPGWRLLIFIGIFVALGFLAKWIVLNGVHLKQRPSLDPVGTISDELQALIQALLATWIMGRFEHRRFAKKKNRFTNHDLSKMLQSLVR